MNRLNSLIIFELYNKRRSIFIWTLSLFFIMLLYMGLFPYVSEMASIKLEVMPSALLKLFGMDKSMLLSNYTSYFAMVYRLLLVGICFYATKLSSNLIYNEEKSKSIEFLNSLAICRYEIYIAKAFVSCLASFVVVLFCFLANTIAGLVVNDITFVLSDTLVMFKYSYICVLFFWALGLFVSGLGKKLNSPTICNGILMFTYVLGYLSLLIGNKTSWLKFLSPFELFAPSNALNISQSNIIALIIYALLVIIMVFSGAVLYKRRDLNI